MKKISFEAVEKFCYLGDLLSAGGGADTAISTRTSCGWKKFWELAPILTNKQKSQIAGKEKALPRVCTTYYYVRK